MLSFPWNKSGNSFLWQKIIIGIHQHFPIPTGTVLYFLNKICIFLAMDTQTSKSLWVKVKSDVFSLLFKRFEETAYGLWKTVELQTACISVCSS